MGNIHSSSFQGDCVAILTKTFQPIVFIHKHNCRIYNFNKCEHTIVTKTHRLKLHRISVLK